jgi:isopenicillin-N epimerase
LILPVADLVRRAREHGIISVIDGAHAPGQIPVHLETLGADFYVANCHKWMCAPKGSAFLYARRAVQPLLRPLVVSWGWRNGFLEEQERQGTRDIAAFLATPAAIEFLRSPVWADVPPACHALARDARAAIAALTGLPALSPDGPEWYAQMVSIPLPLADGEATQRRLYAERKIEVPIMTWNDRRLLRISVQGYNARADIDALTSALAGLLAEPSHSG